MTECFRKKTFKVLSDGGEIVEIDLLEPSNEESEEFLKNKLHYGKTYQFDVKENRNYEFHKKYMKLIRFCFNNLREPFSTFLTTFEQTRTALEFEIKNVEYFWSLPVEKEIFNKDKFIELFDKRKTYGIDMIKSAMEFANETVMVPEMRTKHKSIAFDKMSPAEFEELYKRMLDAVTIVLNVSGETVRNELDNFI